MFMFGICFILYFMKISAPKGINKYININNSNSNYNNQNKYKYIYK